MSWEDRAMPSGWGTGDHPGQDRLASWGTSAEDWIEAERTAADLFEEVAKHGGR